jgi:hypothetical protein
MEGEAHLVGNLEVFQDDPCALYEGTKAGAKEQYVGIGRVVVDGIEGGTRTVGPILFSRICGGCHDEVAFTCFDLQCRIFTRLNCGVT